MYTQCKHLLLFYDESSLIEAYISGIGCHRLSSVKRGVNPGVTICVLSIEHRKYSLGKATKFPKPNIGGLNLLPQKFCDMFDLRLFRYCSWNYPY